jgi:concanavalin A-like lectin/glucanase superfamily protein
MPTYQETVLSKSPFYFARLKELSGTSIADISGNSYPGTFFSDAGFGHGSPIETDAGDTAIGGRCGIVTAPAPTGAWSVGGWVYAATSADCYLVCRNGQFLLGNSNFVAWDAGAGRIRAFVSNSASDLELSYTPAARNAWYRILLTRNGSTIRLYVNGVLRAQSTLFSSAAMDGAWTSVGTWKLGCGGDSGNLGNLGGAIDEIDLYDYALTTADELEIYESAKASLPLRATITINFSIELNTDQIQAVDLPFGHNFSETFGSGSVPIVETLEYKTNVNQSEPDYQQRVSARPHGPLRTLEYHISPKSGAARSRLHGALYTPGTFYTLPVWSDVGLTTAQANSGTSSISCDTTRRDYEALSYCGVCTDPRDPTTYQFFQISSVADAALTLADTIGTTIPSGSYVFPARVCSISEDTLAVKSFAADHEDMVLRFEVIESELSTRRITTYTPATTYKSIEVFSLESARVQFRDDRPFDVARRIQAHGRDYQYAMDTGSPQVFPVRFLLTSRSALSDFYGWLDARNGKMNPLFVSTKEQDLIASARPTTSTLTVAKTGFSLHHARRHVEFLHTDGSFLRAKVISVTDNGNGTETWAFDQNINPVNQISRISFLKFCVLSSDTIILRHDKGGVSESSGSFRELLTSPA